LIAYLLISWPPYHEPVHYYYDCPSHVEVEKQAYSVQVIPEYRPDEREFYAYHEDDWIRRLLEEFDWHLRKLIPGTYLRDDERWVVDFSIQDNIVEWAGVSSTSGLRWRDSVFCFTLDPGLSLDEVSNDFLSSIPHEIPEDSISNLDKINQEITMILENRGYSDSGPPCRIVLVRDGRDISITLVEGEDSLERVISKTTYTIDKNDNEETILEGFYYQLESGELSNYNICNKDEFCEKLESILSKMKFKVDY